MRMFIAGDVVCNREDGLVCSEDLAAVVRSADFAVCNFEAPVRSAHPGVEKKGVLLDQARQTVAGLASQGFSALVLANNHTLDHGPGGLAETVAEAERCGLAHLGAGASFEAAYRPLVGTIGGVRVGLVAGGEAQFGVLDHYRDEDEAGYAWINHPRIDQTVTRLRESCDLVVVLAHAGLENFDVPQVEWRQRYRRLCELGADVVVGSHPHVPQGVERHGPSLIFYSLGNFFFDTTTPAAGWKGSFAVMLSYAPGAGLSFEPVFHETIDRKVTLATGDDRVDLDALTLMLGEGYEARVRSMTLATCERLRRDLLGSLSPLPYDGSLRGTLGRWVRLVLPRRGAPRKAVILSHLLANESYQNVLRFASALEAGRTGPSWRG